MSRLKDILARYERVKQQAKQLEEEYKDKKRGEAFVTRFNQIQEKAQWLTSLWINYGNVGTIVHIKGKRIRNNKRHTNLKVEENFEIYLGNIDMEDIPELIKKRYPNIVKYTITEIQTNKIITS